MTRWLKNSQDYTEQSEVVAHWGCILRTPPYLLNCKETADSSWRTQTPLRNTGDSLISYFRSEILKKESDVKLVHGDELDTRTIGFMRLGGNEEIK